MIDEWKLKFVNKDSEDEVLNLSPDLQAKFLHIADMIKTFGPHNIGLPHVRPLEEKLWEIRMKGRDNIARSIYILQADKEIVILHTFIKKTQKTPTRAIKMAKSRLKELCND